MARPASPGWNTAILALPPIHGPLHGAEDGAALAHRPKGWLGLGTDGPQAGLLRGRQAHALQALQAADQYLPLALKPRFSEAFGAH